jgi:hypothetical protein
VGSPVQSDVTLTGRGTTRIIDGRSVEELGGFALRNNHLKGFYTEVDIDDVDDDESDRGSG